MNILAVAPATQIAPPPEDSASDQVQEGVLSVADCVRLFEEAEEATYESRKLSERDRDYYDNDQLTAEEIATLKERGQPPIIDNVIAPNIDLLVGFEMDRRIDPKAAPRTPKHEQDAAGATQGLRYVGEEQDYDTKRSAVWRNMLIEGAGGVEVSIGAPGYDGNPEIIIRQMPWDRMWWDPHSSRLDFSDAGHLGGVLWMDQDEAVAKYGADKADIIESTLQTGHMGDTYDDAPKWTVWADRKRRRVRIVLIWIKRQDQWFFAEFTRGGFLKHGPSPYQDDKGQSECPLLFASAKVNRENARYGQVRGMIPLQDALNKARSKAAHYLNTNQIITEDGAVVDLKEARKQAARPDGAIVLNPGGKDKFEVVTRLDLATAHVAMMQDARVALEKLGGNIALQGEALAKGTASGKAIIASQQGGAMELNGMLDSLRHLDIRVYRAVWARIRQFWTAEKWVRVTDDERNLKWLGINVDPAQVRQYAQANPQDAQRISGVVANVAQLDCDITVDDAPDGLTPQLEQFQTLAELKKADVNGELTFRDLIEAAPNLPNKDKILQRMDERQAQAAQQQQGPPPEVAILQAKTQAELEANNAKTQAEIQANDARTQADMDRKNAEFIADQQRKDAEHAAELQRQTHKGAHERELARIRAVADAKIRRAQAGAKTAGKGEDMPDYIVDEDEHAEEQERDALAQAVEHLAAVIAAPKQIVRDPRTNMIIGAKTGAGFVPLQRDAQGNAIGVGAPQNEMGL